MPSSLSEPAVWALLERIAERIQKADLPGFKAFFAIGSLAGGYYLPGQSDVDLLVLFAGSRPVGGEYKRETKVLKSLVGPVPENLAIEILPRYESDLVIDPNTGLYLHPDLVARLLIQSRLLAGRYDLSNLKMPGPRDFQAEFPSQLNWWRSNHGPQETCTALLQAKYLLLVLRSWLAVFRNQIIYNKRDLITAYQRSQPSQALTPPLERLLSQHLKTEPIQPGYEKELIAFCGQLSSEIVDFQF
jgi:predicted nucleotidyltransferase